MTENGAGRQVNVWGNITGRGVWWERPKGRGKIEVMTRLSGLVTCVVRSETLSESSSWSLSWGYLYKRESGRETGAIMNGECSHTGNRQSHVQNVNYIDACTWHRILLKFQDSIVFYPYYHTDKCFLSGGRRCCTFVRIWYSLLIKQPTEIVLVLVVVWGGIGTYFEDICHHPPS